MLGKIKYQMKRMKSKKHGYVVIVEIVSLFLVIGGFSFAIFTSSTERRGSLNIVTGDLKPTIESSSLDSNHSLMIKSGESKEIVVTFRNDNGRDAKLSFYYEVAEGVNVSYDSTKDEPPGEEGIVLKNAESKTYRLKIANNTDKDEIITFGGKGGFYNKKLNFPLGKKIVEGIIPIVEAEANMIKVVWDESKSSWVKASNTNWYDYDFGKWANAVTVTSATRSIYQSASSGTAIAMNDIETMWVYVPRYSYTIGSEDSTNYYGKQGVYLNTTPTQALPGEIDVKFIRKDEKELGSAQYKVVEKRSGWRTPDAFTFGTEELSGIWIGKFETSSTDPSVTTVGNGLANRNDLDPIVKPNMKSWIYVQVANIAEVGVNVAKSGNRYGFDSNKVASHAMKNSEWALPAYLSQSKYGKLGNRNYQKEDKDIYQNRSEECITGCSSGVPSNININYGCQYTYEKSPGGTGASTTGTIYGIYDMSGGAWEYTMGVYILNKNRYSGTALYNSGYTGLLSDGSVYTGKNYLEDKYYDFYMSDNTLTSCNGNPCISHDLNETEGWANDAHSTVSTTFPWYWRGGGYYDNNGRAGIFYSNSYYGSMNTKSSFRLVLCIN